MTNYDVYLNIVMGTTNKYNNINIILHVYAKIYIYFIKYLSKHFIIINYT